MQLNSFLPLNFGIEELVKEFATRAAVPVHVLIARIINGRWQEMEELLYAADEQPVDSERHTEIIKVISEYQGGDYIYDELKRIEPEYLTPEQDANSDPEILLELDAMMNLLGPETEVMK